MKVAQLDSGGYIKVTGEFDMFKFSQRDREFFNKVCDLFQQYEKENSAFKATIDGAASEPSEQE